MNGMEERRLLYETSSLPEAEILRGWLESNGITVYSLHDDCGGVSPGLTFSRGIPSMAKWMVEHSPHRSRLAQLQRILIWIMTKSAALLMPSGCRKAMR